MAAPAVTGIRPIVQVVVGRKLMEGAGVKICRTIGLDVRLTPFLMLDHLRLPASEASAGFPDHPHRGFETCTIMLTGAMEHKDSVGNQGIITDGGVQWMTAGRGIIHSEMPVITEGDLEGFQLWINLPAKDKMVKPRYQDIQAADIPTATPSGASVRVMAGTVEDKTGPLKLRNPGMLLDVRMEPGQEYRQKVTPEWNVFAYVYRGNGKLSGQSVKEEHSYIFGTDGDEIVANSGNDGMKFLLIAGKPINEPIVQHGPFVMNSALEIRQAFADYHAGSASSQKSSPEGYDLVLSSGFLAFAAHAGFLQAVEDVGLPVRGVMGTSSGAMTGAMYSAGFTAREIAQEFSRMAPIKRVKLSHNPLKGVLSLEPAMRELAAKLPPTFEQLDRDFACSVVGLNGGPTFQDNELIDSGSLPEAVVASAAVPVLFSPIDIPTGRQNPYVDGGVACRIGLDLWRQHRCQNPINPRPAVVHLIGRSSPFSGNDSLTTLGRNVSVVCSPKSGASLWDLSGFDEQFEAARERALEVLKPLAEEHRMSQQNKAAAAER